MPRQRRRRVEEHSHGSEAAYDRADSAALAEMDSVLGTMPVFTTGQIANIFDVNINTVVKWFESGQLKGYKLPDSDARRVPRDELVKFHSKREYHVAAPRPDSVDILLASRQASLASRFHRAVESAFGYNLHIASCVFEAGVICARRVPQAIFVHLRHTDFVPEQFRLSVKRRPQIAQARLIAVASAGLDRKALARGGFEGFLRLPVSRDAILDAIDTAVAKSEAAAVKFPYQKH